MARKIVIQRIPIQPGAMVTVVDLRGTDRVFIVLIHGDGDPSVRLTIVEHNTSTAMFGDEQGIYIADGDLRIYAENVGSSMSSTPTISIVSLPAEIAIQRQRW